MPTVFNGCCYAMSPELVFTPDARGINLFIADILLFYYFLLLPYFIGRTMSSVVNAVNKFKIVHNLRESA